MRLAGETAPVAGGRRSSTHLCEWGCSEGAVFAAGALYTLL